MSAENITPGPADTVEVEDLDPSELGTKEYWDDSYKDELSNFKSHGIVGDTWFGEDILDKVVMFLTDADEVTQDSSIVDLGCGNGAMLLELAREGFKNLTGLDYSENAIELSRTHLEKNDYTANLQVANLLEDLSPDLDQFDVILDKGTFDAISLCPNVSQNEARSKYFSNVVKMFKNENSIFILTSCNWTTSELVSMSTNYLKKVKIIPTPTFMFGGKAGNVVSIVVFVKK